MSQYLPGQMRIPAQVRDGRDPGNLEFLRRTGMLVGIDLNLRPCWPTMSAITVIVSDVQHNRWRFFR